MPCATTQSEGVYEKNPGLGIWYVRYRVNGKLVRKAIGKYQAALDYHRKAKVLIRSGEGYVPDTAKGAPKTHRELEREMASPAGVTVGELCDGLLAAIQADPDAYQDQHNPPIRIGRIKAKFGDRLAEAIKAHEIKDWIGGMSGPKGKAKLAPATKNRYKAVFSSIYSWGKEEEIISVNPARGFKRWKESPGVIRYLDPAEEDRLRDVLLSDVEAFPASQPILRQRHMHHVYELDVALGTGVRRSEQYRMTLDALNFDRREIVIPKTSLGRRGLCI